MPNHCSCCLRLSPLNEKGQLEVEEFFNGVVGSENFVSVFLPVPEDLKGIHCGGALAYVRQADGSVVKEYVKNWREIDGENWGLPVEEQEILLERYGALNALDWQRETWGTKWGAYDQVVDVDSREVRFDSAWASPSDAVLSISESFPNVKFVLAFSEGGASYYGTETYVDGAEKIECSVMNTDFWEPVPEFSSEEEEAAYYSSDYKERLCEPAKAHLSYYGLHAGG